VRYVVVVFWMLCCSVTSAVAQVSIGIGLPGVSIGINLPVYPQLVQVPGYPVYYAPQLNSNFFFYDGMYWVYQGDNWYASSWYNGPWGLVGPQYVPPYVLRIPVRYYLVPPPYFRGWHGDAPPRWGEHWGNDWSQQRRGWDQWNRKSAPAPAPLPSYQRQYSGDRYPHQVEQQQALRSQNYRYQPRDAVVQQHYQAQPVQSPVAPAQRGQAGASQDRASRPQDAQRASPQAPGQQGAQGGPQQRGPTVQDQGRPPPQGSPERPQEEPKSSQKDMPQGKGMSQAPQQVQGQGQGQSKGHDKAGDGGKP
jgi:hypothetical protein